MNPALFKVLASTGLKVATALPMPIRRAQDPVHPVMMPLPVMPVAGGMGHPPLDRADCDPLGRCTTLRAPLLPASAFHPPTRVHPEPFYPPEPTDQVGLGRPTRKRLYWLNEEMQRRCLDQTAFGRIVQTLTDEANVRDSVGLGPAIIFSPTNQDWRWFGLRDLRHNRFKGWIYTQGRTALRLTTGHYALYWAGVGWQWRKCLPAGTPAENSAAVFGQYTWLLCDTEAAWALHESDQAYTLPGHATAKWRPGPDGWVTSVPTFQSGELDLFAYEGS